jgi:hypothetical protein
MATLETFNSSAENSRPYSVDDLVGIMNSSFFYSRGDEDAQETILRFVAINYGHKFDSGVLKIALEPAIESAHRIVGNTKLHPQAKDSIEKQVVESMVTRFVDFLAGEVDSPSALPNEELARSLLDADYKWHPSGEGLPMLDPARSYKSNLVQHGMLGKSAGRSEFTAMFKIGTQAVVTELISEEYYLYNLHRVLVGHLSTQPNDKEGILAYIRNFYPEGIDFSEVAEW